MWLYPYCMYLLPALPDEKSWPKCNNCVFNLILVQTWITSRQWTGITWFGPPTCTNAHNNIRAFPHEQFRYTFAILTTNITYSTILLQYVSQSPVKVQVVLPHKPLPFLVYTCICKGLPFTLHFHTRTHTHTRTVQLHYYGRIKQSTGEDWENASLSLSTAEPSVGGSAPCLGIHYIQFRRPALSFGYGFSDRLRDTV